MSFQKHLIHTALYGIDIRPSKAYVAAALLSPEINTVNTVFVGDSATLLAQKGKIQWINKSGDLREICIPKFDVVIGNPPYQSPVSGDRSLWAKFAQIAINVVADGGHVVLVHPKGWMSPTADIRIGGTKLKELFVKNGRLDYVNVSEKINTKYFKGIGQDICWYIFTKGNSHGATLFDDGNESMHADIAGFPFFPKQINQTGLTIFEKVFNHTGQDHFRFVFKMFRDFDRLSRSRDAQHRFPRWNGNSNHAAAPLWDSVPCPFEQVRKIFVPYNGTKYMFLYDDVGQIGITKGYIYEVPQGEDMVNVRSFLDSNLVSFLVNQKYTQYNEAAYINSIPKLDMGHVWTDEMIYKYFRLTRDEIKFIEGRVRG